MRRAESKMFFYCLDCFARVDADRTVCWLCGASVSPPPDEADSGQESVDAGMAQPRRGHVPSRAAMQFSLASLLQIMTLASVLLGLTATHPGVGLVLSAIALPAVIRTWIVSFQAARADVRLSSGERIAEFVLSYVGFLAIAAVCSVILGAALFVMGFVDCMTGRSSGFSIAEFSSLWWIPTVGVVVAGVIAVRLYRSIFCKRE